MLFIGVSITVRVRFLIVKILLIKILNKSKISFKIANLSFHIVQAIINLWKSVKRKQFASCCSFKNAYRRSQFSCIFKLLNNWYKLNHRVYELRFQYKFRLSWNVSTIFRIHSCSVKIGEWIKYMYLINFNEDIA